MGGAIGLLLEVPIEPIAVKDTDVLERTQETEGENSPYRLMRQLYEIAAAITKEQRLAERKKTIFTQEELEEIIQRTSVQSLVTRRNPSTLSPPQEHSQGEGSISFDDLPLWDDGNLPEEYRESSDQYHFINPNETLEGIALRYSVRAADLRRANRIQNAQDFYSLDAVVIPSAKQKQGSTSSPLSSRDEIVIQHFMKQTGEDLNFSSTFLRKFGYQLRPALQRYFLEKEKHKCS